MKYTTYWMNFARLAPKLRITTNAHTIYHAVIFSLYEDTPQNGDEEISNVFEGSIKWLESCTGLCYNSIKRALDQLQADNLITYTVKRGRVKKALTIVLNQEIIKQTAKKYEHIDLN